MSVVASNAVRASRSGVVRVDYIEEPTGAPVVSTEISDDTVLTTLAKLRSAGLRVIPSGEALDLIPDAHLWIDGSLYLVRPPTRRNWTIRQALRDAEHIVRTVQSRAVTVKSVEVA